MILQSADNMNGHIVITVIYPYHRPAVNVCKTLSNAHSGRRMSGIRMRNVIGGKIHIMPKRMGTPDLCWVFLRRSEKKKIVYSNAVVCFSTFTGLSGPNIFQQYKSSMHKTRTLLLTFGMNCNVTVPSASSPTHDPSNTLT